MGRSRSVADQKARDLLMLPIEVAGLFRVDPKTPVRWAKAELIPSVKTPGGHHLFRRADIVKLVGLEVMDGDDTLMLPDEVADVFRVDSKTVVRWGQEGRLQAVRTPSGHYRFRKSVISAQIETPAQTSKEPQAS